MPHTDLTNLTEWRVASPSLVGFAECTRRMAHTSDSDVCFARFATKKLLWEPKGSVVASSAFIPRCRETKISAARKFCEICEICVR